MERKYLYCLQPEEEEEFPCSHSAGAPIKNDDWLRLFLSLLSAQGGRSSLVMRKALIGKML